MGNSDENQRNYENVGKKKCRQTHPIQSYKGERKAKAIPITGKCCGKWNRKIKKNASNGLQDAVNKETTKLNSIVRDKLE